MDTSDPHIRNILNKLALVETFMTLCVLGAVIFVVVVFFSLSSLLSGPGSEAIIGLPIGGLLWLLLFPAAGFIIGLVYRTRLQGKLKDSQSHNDSERGLTR